LEPTKFYGEIGSPLSALKIGKRSQKHSGKHSATDEMILLLRRWYYRWDDDVALWIWIRLTFKIDCCSSRNPKIEDVYGPSLEREACLLFK